MMVCSVRRLAAVFACVVLAGCGSVQLPSMSFIGGGEAAPSKALVGSIVVPPNLVVAAAKPKENRAALDARKAEMAAAIGAIAGETVVARLKRAGLEATLGATDISSAETATLVVTGRVRSVEQADRAKRKFVGFGRGRSFAAADVNLSLATSEGRKAVVNVQAEADIGRPAPGRPGPAVETASGLPPEAEALAQRLGDAIADRIIDHATTQGWVKKPS